MNTFQGTGTGRRIAVCLDDHGLHDGIDAATLELAAIGRLSAVSVMSEGPTWPASADALRAVRQARGDALDVGLHLNLTEPLGGEPGRPLGRLIAQALLGRLDRKALADTIARQIDRFEDGWGAAPDHIDGHQHVHQLPQVRELLLAEMQRRWGRAPAGARPWLRASASRAAGRCPSGSRPRSSRRSAPTRCAAGQGGWPVSGRLLGVHDFQADGRTLGSLLETWFTLARDGDLLMCHPGAAPRGASAPDPIAAARATELALWRSEALGELLERRCIHIEPMSRLLAR
ncbi:MAG: ChbG/HpnK family deacetylase [Sphaerotilus natans]